jgi:quercetin dioxygenase-like cupin family protein
MKSWDLRELETPDGVRSPVVLDSSAARAILVELRPGESLGDHEVREHAWVVVISGDVAFTTATGEEERAPGGTLVAFEPGERHAVVAENGARLLMFLAPWPGAGHDPAEIDTPGAILADLGQTLVETASRTSKQVRAAINSRQHH